jgi:hypothetical protein
VLNVAATLIAGNEREPAMLDLVPLAGDDDTNGLPAWRQAWHLPSLTSNDQLRILSSPPMGITGCLHAELSS